MVLTQATIWGTVTIFIVLIIVSVIVHDFSFIIEHPLYFTIETCMMGILPSLPLMVFFMTRKLTHKQVILTYLIMVIQFGSLHVLCQLSGIYSYVFKSMGTSRFLN